MLLSSFLSLSFCLSVMLALLYARKKGRKDVMKGNMREEERKGRIQRQEEGKTGNEVRRMAEGKDKGRQERKEGMNWG